MGNTGRTFAAICLALLAAGAGAQAVKTPDTGTLVICGSGGLRESFICDAMLRDITATSATVGIIPTASPDAPASVKACVDEFDKVLGGPRTSGIMLTTSTAADAGLTTVAAAIASHSVLFFTGGDQSRITSVFRPGGTTTPAYEAVMSVLARGGVIGGSSAGAAMMSDPMITGGTSASALRFGAWRDYSENDGIGVGIGPGMGIFPFGLIDQHFIRRSRYGRLIVALEELQQPAGWGVEEHRAIAVNLSSATATTLGSHALALIDVSGMANDGGTRSNIRYSLLGAGDSVHLITRGVTPAPGHRSLSRGTTETKTFELGPWEEFALVHYAEALAAGVRQAGGRDGEFEVRVTADDETRFWRTEWDGKWFVSASGLRMDIVRHGAASLDSSP